MARKLTKTEIEFVWKNAGGSNASAPMAAAIAMAESGGDPNAVHTNSDGSVDRGLWQINSVHGKQSTTNLMDNAKAAVAISGNGHSWHPWTTFTSGAYKRFLGLKDTQTSTGADVNQSLTGITPTVSAGVGGAADALAAIGTFLALLAQPVTWLHVLEVVGGALLLVLGLRTLTGMSNDPVALATKVAKVAA